MAIHSFVDHDAELFFTETILPRKKGWSGVGKIVKRKLDMLHYARELKDLFSPPSNRLESLDGEFAGCYSIRINDQWRVVFSWDSQPYDVRVIDYH
ncbi:MAG: type II toxin-antitoxin system RelE/ParE family toxin [Chlamydiales bacterium]